MNFCFSVCEYDPLHYGHVYHLSQMKKTDSDAVIVIMSGNFTQRGEVAVLDKYTRAEHAVLCGADMVVELPTVFAVSPAEIFAGGAMKIIAALGGGKLCFGTEVGTADEFLALARASTNESREFKEELKRRLSSGVPFANARTEALKATATDCNFEIMNNPNSVLGLEYAKAAISQGTNVELLPIERVGAGYKDKELGKNFCSAAAIRQAIKEFDRKKVKKFVPPFVFRALPERLPDPSQAVLYSLLSKSADELGGVIDCTEGLENRIKVISRSARTFDELIDRLETKRYTRARLSRIATSAMLGIDAKTVDKCQKSDLYVKVLAVAKDRTDLLGEVANKLSGSRTSLITRKNDADALGGIKRVCFDIDAFAVDMFNLIAGVKTNEYEMRIVDRG